MDERPERPTAACIDSHTLGSTPESSGRGGHDGYKRRKGSKVHLAIDTLGHLLALVVTPADVGDREVVADLATWVRDASEAWVEVAFVDQGYTGGRAATAGEAAGIELAVVKLPRAKRGFVLLPRRWVVGRPSHGRHGSAGWRGTTGGGAERAARFGLRHAHAAAVHAADAVPKCITSSVQSLKFATVAACQG